MTMGINGMQAYLMESINYFDFWNVVLNNL